MSNMGANIAIIRDDKILLTKREDFEVWCLPGGMTDSGESLAQTAIREAREETGYAVCLSHMVGAYTRIGGYQDLHGILFVGQIIGGELAPQVEEVIDTGWFALSDLPRDLFWWHRPQIKDALLDHRGVVGVAYLTAALDARNRLELYALRDQSGLSRSEFYHHYFESKGTRYEYQLGADSEFEKNPCTKD